MLIFVLVGIYCHWCFVWFIADMGITQQLTIVVKRRNDGPSFATATSENIRFLFNGDAEFRSKLTAGIEKVYRGPKRPQVVRVKYVDEHFISLDPDALAHGDHFHAT